MDPLQACSTRKGLRVLQGWAHACGLTMTPFPILLSMCLVRAANHGVVHM